MDPIGIAVIALVVLFVLYRIGAIKFAQKATERGISMTDRMMDTMDLESEEKHSKNLGKIITKLQDPTIKRATSKEVRAIFAQGFATPTK